MADYVYNFGGVSYSTDRELSPQEIDRMVQMYSDSGLLNPEVQMQQEMQWKDVSQNKHIKNAFRTYYEEHNGEQFEGDDEELTDAYFEQMRWFENNTGSMLKLVGRLKGAGSMSERERMALAIMWKAWDNIVPFYEDENKKWTAFIDHVGANVLDLANLSGLASFGTGTAAAITAKQVAKAGLKETLFAGMKTGAKSGALNAGAVGTGLAAGNQEIHYELEGLERDWSNVAMQGGASTIMGTGVGGFLGTAGAGVKHSLATNIAAKEADKAAMGDLSNPYRSGKYNQDDIINTAAAAENWRYVLADETISGELRQEARKEFIRNLGDSTRKVMDRNHRGINNSIPNEQAYNNGIQLLNDLGIKDTDNLTVENLVDDLYSKYTKGEIALKDSTSFKALTYKLEQEMYDRYLMSWDKHGDPWKAFDQFEKVLLLSEDLSSASGRDLQLSGLRQRLGPSKYGMVLNSWRKAYENGTPRTLDEVKVDIDKAKNDFKGHHFIVDSLNEWWIHNILGSPVTLSINTVSSAAHMLERNAIDIGAAVKRGDVMESRRAITTLGRELTAIPSAFIYALKAAGRSRGYVDPQRVYAGEVDDLAPVIGNKNYDFNRVVGNTRDLIMGKEAPNPLREFKEKDESFVTAAANLVGNFNRLIGGRGMLATDEFVKQMAFRGELRARVTMEALELVGKDGRFGTAAEAHAFAKAEFNKLMNQHFDNIGMGIEPKDPRLIEAHKAAREATFQHDFRQDPLGNVGKAVARISGKYPILKQIQPFVRTPTNLASWGLERTPGLQVLSREFNEMLHSPDPQVRAKAEMAMNLGVMYWTAALTTAMAGQLQGPGNTRDYGSKKIDETSENYLPYSIKLEDGTRVRISRGDPIARFFMTIGAMQDSMAYGSDEDGINVFGAAALSTAKALIDVPSLTGIADIFNTGTDIVSGNDPAKALGDFSANRFKTMVPYYRMYRDYLQPAGADRAMFTNIGYKPEDIWNTALFADDPADPYDKERDALGRERFMLDNFGNVLTGLQQTRPADDPVLNELSRLNSNRFAPAPTRNGVNLKKIKVKPGGRQSVYDLWRTVSSGVRIKGMPGTPKNKAGANLEEAMAHLIQSKAYKEVYGDNTRLTQLNSTIAQYESWGWSQLQEILGKDHEVFRKTAFKEVNNWFDDVQAIDPFIEENQDDFIEILKMNR